MTLNSGSYWSLCYTFSLPKINPGLNESSVSTAEFVSKGMSLVFPKVVKIPMYVDSSLLSQRVLGTRSRNQEIFDHMRFRYDLAKSVSYLATNIWNKSIDKHAGCPVVYKFEFFGFIQGFEVVDDNVGDLPNGITVVRDIFHCRGELNAIGCAELGGRKIAIAVENYAAAHDDWRNGSNLYESRVIKTILHEIGHNYGLDHIVNKPDEVDNIMHSPGTTETASYITREQCTALSRPGVSGYFNYPPWEGYFNVE